MKSIEQHRPVARAALLASVFVWAWSWSAFAADPATPNPHVVVLLVDDMGYGDPGCYNPQSRVPTPNIDFLARDGMRFVDAHAPAPLCHTSRYGLLTGEYPFRADVGRWPQHAVIEPGRATIASILQAQGYRTAMVGKWHLGFEEGDYTARWQGGPVDAGFDSFFGIRASTDIPPYFYIRNDRVVEPPTLPIAAHHSTGWSPIQGEFWRAGKIAPHMKLGEVLPRIVDEAVSIIQRHAADKTNPEHPLMLYVALPAPHTPWLPAKEYADAGEAGMYGNFVSMVDAMTGRILAALHASGMADDTLLIFTSDNGPVWYDQDVERFGHDSSGGLRGMKGDAWEAGHRMPFIVRWPGKVRPGSTSRQMICFTDLLATLANLVGQQLADNDGPDSVSFLSELLNDKMPSAEARKTLVIQSSAGMMTVRDDNWKLIGGLGSGGFSRPAKIEHQPGQPQGQLYDLTTDLGEEHNLYDQRPEIVRRLKEVMASVVAADSRN